MPQAKTSNDKIMQAEQKTENSFCEWTGSLMIMFRRAPVFPGLLPANSPLLIWTLCPNAWHNYQSAYSIPMSFSANLIYLCISERPLLFYNKLTRSIHLLEMRKQQRNEAEITVAKMLHQRSIPKTGSIRFRAAFLVTFFPQKK